MQKCENRRRKKTKSQRERKREREMGRVVVIRKDEHRETRSKRDRNTGEKCTKRRFGATKKEWGGSR